MIDATGGCGVSTGRGAIAARPTGAPGPRRPAAVLEEHVALEDRPQPVLQGDGGVRTGPHVWNRAGRADGRTPDPSSRKGVPMNDRTRLLPDRTPGRRDP
ncbi:hypothetical protein GCM10010363_43870 [Streptomyces omiyaensis]|nr:hypothetical protein GCM10010363_43870 [Streptomyces omiyaensis]